VWVLEDATPPLQGTKSLDTVSDPLQVLFQCFSSIEQFLHFSDVYNAESQQSFWYVWLASNKLLRSNWLLEWFYWSSIQCLGEWWIALCLLVMVLDSDHSPQKLRPDDQKTQDMDRSLSHLSVQYGNVAGFEEVRFCVHDTITDKWKRRAYSLCLVCDSVILIWCADEPVCTAVHRGPDDNHSYHQWNELHIIFMASSPGGCQIRAPSLLPLLFYHCFPILLC
jgi:hypothetical protein